MQVGCVLGDWEKLKIGNDDKYNKNKNSIYIVYTLNSQRINKIYQKFKVLNKKRFLT